jgi:hypothetical protein
MEFTPTVNQAAEFLEISNDFTNPKEVVREAISNSFDASAKNIKIEIYIDRSSGIDELVINIEDDGEGMDEEALKAFFGLGYSTRVAVDRKGFKVSPSIGEKGHGTKVYFNSRRIEVKTWKNNQYLDAYMDSPRQALRTQKVPKVTYEMKESAEQRHGSNITIFGYNSNIQAGFSHNEIKDYIFWFTKFGSFEPECGIETCKDVKIQLRGLGIKEFEALNFGHKFAEVNTNLKTLKGKDKISPLDYYVARWVFKDVEVIGKPGSTINFVFYIEGDKAKREYNKMIHEKWQTWKPGEYDVGDRYGLWLCKDHIPVERKGEWNKWVAEKSEWTKYHAFVNCQDFKLTANRGDLENTPADLLEAVGKTVKDLFDNVIKPTKEFQKYGEELVTEQVERTAQQEETDFNRRRKEALGKNVAKIDDTTLLEPRNEGGVFSLFMQLKTARPNLFDFEVVDYDTSLGYDLLITKDTALDLNQASMKFVEMKYELKRSFDHSFGKLWAILCWDCKLANDEEVRDIMGEKRNMKITSKDYSAPDSYKKYMLISNIAPHNIEVFVLKDYLKDKLGLDFRPRSTQ